MGSEQSSQLRRQRSLEDISSSGTSSSTPAFRRQHTVAAETFRSSRASPTTETGENRPRSTSPGPSVCSDIDLPYISYTVNRPIGDSPKLIPKPPASKKKIALRKPVPSKTSAHNIVVVKNALVAPNVERDPDILRLQQIPMFLPIMRATLNLPAARDPEVLEWLDPAPLNKLCTRYYQHYHACANLVATEQNALTQKIRETDIEVAKLVSHTTEKQKRIAKYIEKLSKVTELSNQLNKCHLILNQTLEKIEALNSYLPVEDRLEPFVWTTG